MTVPPASQRLLREIARRDEGHGVQFDLMPRRRYRLAGTDITVNQRTFYPLTAAGLVTDNEDDTAPVCITDAGRAFLSA